jgi:hypothetical protein
MHRVAVLALLFGALPLSACGSNSHPEAPRDAVTELDAGSVLLHAGYSGFDDPERLVVRDSVHWAGVWATAFERQTRVPPLPAVDFAREMVVVAALGARPSGGYDITIEGVVEELGGAVVFVVATSPGDDCYTTAAITEPVIMLRAAAVAGRIRFEERAETRSCEEGA